VSGHTYEGELFHFVAGFCRHGQGRATFATGGVYTGQHVYGTCDGQGTYTFPGWGSVQGTFKRNQLVEGKLTYKNGDVYEGAFKPVSEPTPTTLYATEPRHGVGAFVEEATGARYEGLEHSCITRDMHANEHCVVLVNVEEGRRCAQLDSDTLCSFSLRFSTLSRLMEGRQEGWFRQVHQQRQGVL
jgi:hypothetical protein